MPRSKSTRTKRQNRAATSLQETGIRVTLLGLGFLIVPAFFGSSAVFKTVANGLSMPGWILLSAGLLMLGAAYLRARQQAAAAPIWRPGNLEESQLSAVIAQHALRTPHAARQAVPPAPLSSPSPAPKPGAARQRTGRAASTPDIASGRTANAAFDPPAPPQREWNPAVFSAIEWRRFEAVCEGLFAQAGFRTESQSHGADGGVDVWMYSAHAVGPVAIAQCKHWRNKPVGVKEVREFFGVMASHQLKRGTYATSSIYTAEALQFAKANGINALDGAGLLKLIGTRTPDQQQALLDVAFEGEYWRPTCASCGIKLVERRPAAGKVAKAFWGCSNYPRCKSMLNMAAG